MRQYTILEDGYIQYEENGFLVTIPNDPNNADYQAYLNKDNPDWNKPTL